MLEEVHFDSIDGVVRHVREFFDIRLSSLWILLFELLEDIENGVVSVLHDVEKTAFGFAYFEANIGHTRVNEFF
jgi:hypothetical protein